MAWVGVNENDFVKAYEDLTVPDSAGASVTSVDSTVISHNLSNKKFIATLLVTGTCAGDGALDVKLQGSYDQTTWIDVDASLSIDVDPTAANTATAFVDTTGIECAYWKFVVFSDGTDTEEDATVRLTYSAKVI